MNTLSSIINYNYRQLIPLLTPAIDQDSGQLNCILLGARICLVAVANITAHNLALHISGKFLTLTTFPITLITVGIIFIDCVRTMQAETIYATINRETNITHDIIMRNVQLLNNSIYWENIKKNSPTPAA
jgi:hypothetical protein